MDQPIYEAYEFLQDDDESQTESQFLVVQNDGTFLTVNRPVQYISQGENVKTVEGTPAEFDGNQQEFFVDNSQELTDQFVVSNGDNSEYANSFLLKTIENVKNEEQNEQPEPEYEIPNYVDGKPIEDTDMETQEIQNTYEEVPVESPNTEEKAPSQGDCTEITLSDEQYQQLQEKGWILLEFADKKFLLDSVGLHDITDNHELQEKLKSEVTDQNTTSENNSSNPDLQEFIKTETGDQTSANAIDQDIQETTRVINKSNLIKEKVQKSNKQIIFKQEPEEVEVETSPEKVPVLSHNPIKIKTNYLFKDIPSRVVLGKTAKGQDLVARVVKTNRPMADTTANVNCHPSGPNYTGLTEVRFEKLVRQKLNENEHTSKEDIAAAEVVVKQLLSVPSFRSVVVGRQLVITKSVTVETSVGAMYCENKSMLVTGRVSDDGQGLTHIPNMLQKLLSDGEAILYFRRSKDINEGSFLHIHSSEMKAVDGIVRVSITLNKRHLPLKLVKEQIKLRQVYACSSCAVMFEGEEQLRHHQQTECMEVDGTLTIDTDNQKSAYTVFVEDGKEKQFVCNQCQMTFTKLGYCQRHVKIHFNNENEAAIIDENEKQKKKVYKCKMCPSAYSHQATLSKHIVSKHLQAEFSMMNQAKVIKTYARSSQAKNPIEVDDDEDDNEQPKGGKSVYYKCKICPSTYVHPATLTKHILSEHVRNKT